MKQAMRKALVVTALTAAGASGATAQDQPGEPVRPPTTPAVERIIRMREQLVLTEAQIADLDAIRRESVARRSAAAAELAELRSQLTAGLIERSDVSAFLEQRRDEDRRYSAEKQERVASILDEAQLESLRELRRGGRAFDTGRLGPRHRGRPALRGRRPGVRRGWPGLAGPRWGPPRLRNRPFSRRGAPVLEDDLRLGR